MGLRSGQRAVERLRHPTITFAHRSDGQRAVDRLRCRLQITTLYAILNDSFCDRLCETCTMSLHLTQILLYQVAETISTYLCAKKMSHTHHCDHKMRCIITRCPTPFQDLIPSSRNHLPPSIRLLNVALPTWISPRSSMTRLRRPI